MSTDPVPPISNHTFSLQETTALIIKHLGIHEGKFDLMLEFQIGVGQFGPSSEHLLPGAAVGVSKIGIVESPAPGASTVDASIVNPKPKTTKPKTRKTTSPK
ncbi:hypothetical protein [Propionivibrio sp.]|uniref:hypothetical protein n=1 Tax=Propionivibrio sp. TaxID=2212460 RepID=UPI003BF3E71F